MKYDDRHGGPYDRGRMDKYYGRCKNPHKYQGDTYKSPLITDLTPEEIEAYNAGYDQEDDEKDWG